MSGQGITLAVKPRGSAAAVVWVGGEIDGFTAPRLAEAVDEAFELRVQRVLIDLGKVRFFGTAGIAVLIEANVRALRERVLLVLVCSNALVLRPLELTGLGELFAVSRSIESALATYEC